MKNERLAAPLLLKQGTNIKSTHSVWVAGHLPAATRTLRKVFAKESVSHSYQENAAACDKYLIVLGIQNRCAVIKEQKAGAMKKNESSKMDIHREFKFMLLSE